MPGKRKPLAKHVVLVSVDGMTPDYYLGEHWPAPAIRQLYRQGTHAQAVRTIFPSLTYPGHVTLVTGALPARHGVYNNVALEPVDTPAWLAGQRHPGAGPVGRRARRRRHHIGA